MIIAVDFDGTLTKGENFPRIGEPNTELINHLIERKRAGDSLILFTCRNGEYLMDAILWCRKLGLEFDAVNDDDKTIINNWKNDRSSKVCADIYIDDRAVTPEDFLKKI